MYGDIAVEERNRMREITLAKETERGNQHQGAQHEDSFAGEGHCLDKGWASFLLTHISYRQNCAGVECSCRAE